MNQFTNESSIVIPKNYFFLTKATIKLMIVTVTASVIIMMPVPSTVSVAPDEVYAHCTSVNLSAFAFDAAKPVPITPAPIAVLRRPIKRCSRCLF